MAGLDEDFFAADMEPVDDIPAVTESEATQETAAEPEPEIPGEGDEPDEGETEDGTEQGAVDESPAAQGRLKAVQAEREKRQAAERENADLKRQLEAATARQQTQQPEPTQQAQPIKIPDPVLDPEGYEAYRDFREYQLKEQISQAHAVRTHGREKLVEVESTFKELAKSDPSLMQQLRRHPDPYGFAVETVEKRALFSQLEGVGSLEQLIAREAAKLGYVKAGAGAPVLTKPVAVNPQPLLPPRSMAATPAPPRGQPVHDASADAVEIKLFGKG